MHKLGLLHSCTAPRKQQYTELLFKQSKLRFLLLHFNAAKSVHLHYLQDVSLGMERKKYLVYLVNPHTQNLILFKWPPLPNSFSRWNWSQNIPEQDGNIPYSLPKQRWNSSQILPFCSFLEWVQVCISEDAHTVQLEKKYSREGKVPQKSAMEDSSSKS